MQPDFSVHYQSGLAVYSLAFLPTVGTAWNGSAFVASSGAAWPTCATPMADDGAGTYSGNIPAGVPAGTLLVQSYLKLGANPVDTDPVIGTGLVFATGTRSAPTPDPMRSSPTGIT
jgi:hypothetical protein